MATQRTRSPRRRCVASPPSARAPCGACSRPSSPPLRRRRTCTRSSSTRATAARALCAGVWSCEYSRRRTHGSAHESGRRPPPRGNGEAPWNRGRASARGAARARWSRRGPPRRRSACASGLTTMRRLVTWSVLAPLVSGMTSPSHRPDALFRLRKTEGQDWNAGPRAPAPQLRPALRVMLGQCDAQWMEGNHPLEPRLELLSRLPPVCCSKLQTCVAAL
mmetsp:Transcript_2440/g.8084  ORF Transcript_2440/g.8084 Transcript_2440/m.8084 type:complete len:220 (-) Transcript_2440:70-729(-)